MDLGLEVLSNLTVYTKYAKYIPEIRRREKWEEIVDRYNKMMIDKYPQLRDKILYYSSYIRDKKILPSMRALDNDTPIITKNGWSKVGDIRIGDILYDSNGKETIVEEVYQFENIDLYEVKFSDKSSIIACDEHLWVVSSIDDLLLGKKRIVNTMFLKNHLIQSGKRNCHILNPNPIERKNMKLDLDPYILGHWLGDGYSSGYQYSTSVEDSSFFEKEYKLAGFEPKHSTSSNVWTWSTSKLGSKLRQLEVINNKHIPREYLQGSIEQRLSLLQGLMDSDGHITLEGRCIFSNTNQNIIEGTKELLSSLGIKYTVSTKKKKRKEHHLEVINLSFFTTLPVVRLPRKLSRIRKTLKNKRTLYRTVVSVDFIKKGNATCFKVSSPDNTFLAGERMITTHNCLQFAGLAAEVNQSRIYNCCYLPIDSLYSFSEAMFLLLGGTGVGYSVQKHHVDKLPAIHKADKKTKTWVIEDSIMGWADAIKMLMKYYLNGGFKPKFDFRAIRPKGSRLITAGGKAPGPEPLKLCIAHIEAIMDRKEEGTKLTSLEAHDIMCHIANSVLAGGIRRSACIALFSKDDDEMLTCKYGNWYELNEQRGRANNSVVLRRDDITEEEFQKLWKRIELSGSGEPGIFWTNDYDLGTNPCCEISLKPYQFCNLCEVNVSDIESQEDLNNRVRVAAFFGTLQAGFTDFHYLRDIWKKTTEEDSLLGIGMTGIASGEVLKYDLEEAAKEAIEMNKKIASIINVHTAKRITCIKPSGTTSLVLGTSSGIHAWYGKYYLRTMRFNKNEDIAVYLSINHPEICEDDILRPHDTLCVRIPVKAPEGAILRTESAIDILERVKKFHKEWIDAGHIEGINTHNISATISIDKNRLYTYDISPDGQTTFEQDEWEAVGDWMWENRNFYNGLSVLPFDGGSYVQAPFEEITEEEYYERLSHIKSIDLSNIIEMDDTVNFGQVAACAGNACELQI